ncbi:cache domain-containing sensor histidine kinase [Cohnella zeiphila]|uniref:Histidine kinase n=1 Tax=Cohnella zeiphila TaxID=2761120 RepID=A0A7X0SNI9_9BACL|nr:histidine kinase [Cohnella zeiphila]MBB6733257.1 histidine kinase [Cohnella zeiphila]
MPSKLRNIRTILFSTYSLIIIVVFSILVVWFYWWTSDLLKKNATASLESIGQSIQDQTDSELRKMNDVSLNVMYSNLVKDHFKKYLADSENHRTAVQDAPANVPGDSSIQSAKELSDILTAAIGPSRPVEQLYLYDFQGRVYGNGFDNGERAYDPAAKPWYEAVRNAAGKYIDLPVADAEMSKYISSSEEQYSVSLFRLFYDNYNVPIGIVEVKQYANKIFQGILNFAKKNGYDENVLVFDGAGRIVYPYSADAKRYEPYIQFGNERFGAGLASFTSSFRNPGTGERELLSYHRSDFTGWNTVMIVGERKLLKPLTAFTRTMAFVAVAILLLAIFLSFAAAKRITRPILKIHRTIRGIRLDDLGSGLVTAKELNSGLNELDQLHSSFVQMSSRLKQSMDQLLLSQAQELQSKMVALQAQMNPHFLYNTLATIGAMAEENMNEQIVAMVGNLSDILRYITSDESTADLETELEHTSRYLEVNRIRHGAKLQCEFDVDERLLPIRVPKLIVQPLVENALKFATTREPPWAIRVAGTMQEEEWRIEVTDNGPGFSEEALARLKERIAEAERTGVFPTLKLDGMGLINVYIRMKLGYGERFRFEASNRPGGGAAVVIGGSARMGG